MAGQASGAPKPSPSTSAGHAPAVTVSDSEGWKMRYPDVSTRRPEHEPDQRTVVDAWRVDRSVRCRMVPRGTGSRTAAGRGRRRFQLLRHARHRLVCHHDHRLSALEDGAGSDDPRDAQRRAHTADGRAGFHLHEAHSGRRPHAVLDDCGGRARGVAGCRCRCAMAEAEDSSRHGLGAAGRRDADADYPDPGSDRQPILPLGGEALGVRGCCSSWPSWATSSSVR